MPARRRRWLDMLNPNRSEDFCMPGAGSLMPLKTPLLRVSRPVAACQRCRTAKIRCDGKLPACTACERSGRAQQCSSTNSQFAPGKERSYVATLEASAERLEKRILEARKRRQSSLSMLDVISPISPVSKSGTWTPSDRPKDQKAKAREEMHTINELVSDFGFLTIHATARDYTFGFTNSISYARLILASATKEPLPSVKKSLPSRSETLPLVSLYVENCLTLHPIFLEAEVYGSLERIYQITNNAATALDHWTIRMILAVISAMQSKQRGDTLYSDAVGHICEALVVADQVLHPGSIKSIQAMLLLVQYSMLDPAHFDSWTLIGAASRAMVDLGLHQDPSKSSNTPRAKLELRRRIFHCVYSLDRVTSIVQTRAFSFSDDSSSVGLPFSLKKPSSPINTPGATSPGGNMWTRTNEISLAYLEFRKMQSSWYTELFQSGREPWQDPYIRIWATYRNLSDWFGRLPASTPPTIKTFLELDLLYSYVYILSPSPRCPQPSEHAQRLLLQHAATYAKSLLTVMSEPGRVNKLSPFTFYDALRVYMVAKLYIETLTSNLDGLLHPPRHTSSQSAAPSTITLDTEMDPLSTFSAPPPLLSEPSGNSSGEKQSAAQSAISTIDSFLNVLSSFEMRFGRVSGVSWRDKIQQESHILVSQLQQRNNNETGSILSDQSSYFWRKSGPIAGTSVAGDTSSPATHSVSVVSTQLGTSPGRGSTAGAYYPSPAATQYSPNAYAVQDVDAASSSSLLGGVGGGVSQVPLWTTSAQSRGSSPGMMNLNPMHHQPGSVSSMMMQQQQQQQQTPQNIMMPQYPNTAGFTGGEFGIGNMAAWETLPGGNLNARFS